MAGSSGSKGRGEPHSPARRRPALVLLVALALVTPAAAQLLDSTLDEILTDEIDAQVEQQLDAEIADAIEQQVENSVEAAVEATVSEQIEGAVTDSVEQVVEAGVIEAVEQQVERGVTGTLTQQLQSTLEHALGGDLDEIIGDAADGLGQVTRGAGGAAGQALGGDAATAPPAQYVAGVDAAGRAAEREIWVILVPAEHAGRIQSWGFNIRVRQDLGSLDRVLLRVDAPEDREIAQAALDLALDAPGTTVDFNHVYAPGADDVANAASAAALPRAASLPQAQPALAIGIIDSAVAASHKALDGAKIVQRDFVSFDAPRPLAHGTAVASILVGESGLLRKSSARLHAATVFFADVDGSPLATTESLIAALAWHAAEGVNVVSMSLAGPPNRVLEAALTTATARGMLVVAAVGNNGPAGEPLYPAAYASVIGVTAVDSAHRIYRYANRGRHVTFAAPGVRIRVADSDGGYDTQSGTSMAAPYAAAVIAQAVAKRASRSTDDVLATLKSTAIDLGTKDFDDVFGYGLIGAAH